MSGPMRKVLAYPWAAVTAISTEEQVDALLSLGHEMQKPFVSGGRFQDINWTAAVESFRSMIPQSAVGFVGFSACLMASLASASAIVCGASLLGAGVLLVAAGALAAAAMAVGVSFLVASWMAGGFAFVAGGAWGALQAARLGAMAALHAAGLGAALLDHCMAASQPPPAGRSSAVLVPDTYTPRDVASHPPAELMSSGEDDANGEAAAQPPPRKKKAGKRAAEHAAKAQLLRALDKEA